MHPQLYQQRTQMKSLKFASFILITVATMLTAQTPADGLPQIPPLTTKMRVEALKTRHSEALAIVVGGIARIADDPTLLSAKETIDSLERGDKEMHRSTAASVAILTTLRTEIAGIHADSAFTEGQKDELAITAQALVTECDSIRNEANVTIERLSSVYKEMSRWKRVYRAYVNMTSEKEAKDVLKTAVGEYIKRLTAKPATPDTAPSAR